MQAFKIASWVWRIGIAAIWLSTFLGFPGPGMGWLVDAEVWLTNRVPDPILFAFLTGLLLSSWVVPAAWKILRRHILQMETARTDLANLRTAGVRLRNLAMDDENPLDGDELNAWGDQVEAWTHDTVAAIKPLSGADAEWFNTLGTLPPPRHAMALPPIGDDFGPRLHFFSMLDYRLLRLENLIRELRGK